MTTITRNAGNSDSELSLPVAGALVPAASPAFVTTHWTAVLTAGRCADTAQSQLALEQLCRAYWYPLYAYVRRCGHSPHDAQDLTQEFFARLLGKQWLAGVAPEKGRFRTFLLVVLKRFLANEWDHAHAAKRGGPLGPVPLDTAVAESRYQAEPTPKLPADRIYERRWALTLIEQTLARLRREFAAAGKADEFERLKGFLTASHAANTYAKAAAQLCLNEGAARVAVHRLRRRFREIFREEVSHTVAAAEDADEEMRHLLAALAE
jgi:DNA-directed RNA polymerase specialized sigma24 family protein